MLFFVVVKLIMEFEIEHLSFILLFVFLVRICQVDWEQELNFDWQEGSLFSTFKTKVFINILVKTILFHPHEQC